MSEPAMRNMIRMNALAKRLGVTRQTIYDWMKAGTFPRQVNIGNHAVAFYEDEILAWQKEREEQSTAPPRQPLKPLRPRAGFRPPRQR